ncbi:MAG: disulfide isomerase [Gammaproteobacteria bacterium]|nr:disulfide isomerase [Gammaproteobacteria bacterium]
MRPNTSSIHATAVVATLALALSLAACSRKQTPSSATVPASEKPPAAAAVGAKTDSHLPPGIAWFDGDVDAAFAAAKAAPKPLFLYWGAEWCPPCAQIKATIFNRREFQERSRLFVPVYLDGDTPSAQKQGERFGVVGYPTMILFRPDGTEITRLPGNVNIERYAKILDVAIADARPVKEILAAATAGGDVTANDWQLLAYYSWGSDNGRVLPAKDRLKTFRTLSQRCPAEMKGDCARLFFEYLGAAAAETTGGKSPLTGLDRAAARKQLVDLLASPSVDQANLDNLIYGSRDAIGLLSNAGTPERAELTRAWGAALDRLVADKATPLSAPDEIKVLRARVLLAQLDHPGAPLPPALLDQIHSTIARLDAETKDPNARQAVINAAANVYWEAGLDEDANALLVAALEKSPSPYYFMLDLADLAEKAGRKDEAVQWLARAYDGAQGPATRFQWGYSYLVGLLEMTPDDTKAIEQTGLKVIGELGSSPDAFYQRTRTRLEQLSAKLLEWGRTGDRAAVVETLRKRTGDICRGLPAGDEGRKNCERFLSPAAPATQGA